MIAGLIPVLVTLTGAVAPAGPQPLPLTIEMVKSSHAAVIPRAGGFRITFTPAEWPNATFRPAAPWNWKDRGALLLQLTNPGSTAVSFGVRMDDDPAADGVKHSRTAQGTLGPGEAATFAVTFAADPMALGMRGLPPIKAGRSISAGGTGPFDWGHIVNFQIFTHNIPAPQTLVLQGASLAAPVSMAGIVDRFGQYTGADWPGKVHRVSDLAQRRKAEAADLKSHPVLPGRDRFGGWAAGPKEQATGWFRTQRVNGKWWLVDPDGHLFFSTGMDSMNPEEATFVTGREAMFAWLPGKNDPLYRQFRAVSFVHSGPVKSGQAFDFYSANLERKYGPGYQRAWLTTSLARLLSWGFNTIGNWSDPRLAAAHRVPYVATAGVGGPHRLVSSGSDYWGKMPDPFDPAFARDAASSLAEITARVKDDPWCLGYFVDNELSWAGPGDDGRYGLAVGSLAEDAASPAKQALLAQLRGKYGEIAALNGAWHTAFKSWADLQPPYVVPVPVPAAMKPDLSAFVRSYALQYFRVIRNELKRRDPKHLYLGCRFAWKAPEAVDAAAQVCDVVSFNIYAPRLDEKEWSYIHSLGKPCIIGEFHFGALDRGMFHPGLVSTPNQAARAKMYQDYVGSVVDDPSMVGCHWFQYIDEPLTGRTWDGENYNIGFVSVTDTPYREMVAAARAIHGQVYRRRSGGTGAAVAERGRGGALPAAPAEAAPTRRP